MSIGHWVRGEWQGVWPYIVKIGEELGVEFTSTCRGVLGDGRDIRDIRFWSDRQVDDQRLCDRFSMLFHLDRCTG